MTDSHQPTTNPTRPKVKRGIKTRPKQYYDMFPKHILVYLARHIFQIIPHKLFSQTTLNHYAYHLENYESQETQQNFRSACHDLLQLCMQNDIKTPKDFAAIPKNPEQLTSHNYPLSDFFTNLFSRQYPVDYIPKPQLITPDPTADMSGIDAFLTYLKQEPNDANRTYPDFTSFQLQDYLSFTEIPLQLIKKPLNLYQPDEYKSTNYWTMSIDTFCHLITDNQPDLYEPLIAILDLSHMYKTKFINHSQRILSKVDSNLRNNGNRLRAETVDQIMLEMHDIDPDHKNKTNPPAEGK